VTGSPKKRARREAAAAAVGRARAIDPENLPVLHEQRRNGLTLYTEELAAKICADLVRGMTLRQICAQEGMPAPSTVVTWALQEDHPFAEKYDRARRVQYDLQFDELDELSKGPGEGDDQVKVARDRLRVDTLKWKLAKALPKIYGDNKTIEHLGKDGAPLFPELVISFNTIVNPPRLAEDAEPE
jgi:hypothetical protein